MSSSAGRITLWGVELFVATAEERSITAAARRLGTSAATVSQQLTNLEGAIGSVLLNRSERPVTLTPAGEMFLRRANVILNEAEQARAEIALSDLSQLTRLRLGMIEDFDAEVTPRLLSGLAEDLRQCQFLLETGASHRLYEGLDTRALDIIVAADTGIAGEGMEVWPVLDEPFVIAAPRGWAKEGDLLPQLRHLPLVQYTTRHFLGRAVAAHLARQNLTLSHRFELDSYHAIMAMVAGGAGWTIITPLGWMAAQRFRDSVAILPLPLPPLSRTISVIARRGALGTMPVTIAGTLRDLVRSAIVAPAQAELPWLAEGLRVLGR